MDTWLHETIWPTVIGYSLLYIVLGTITVALFLRFRWFIDADTTDIGLTMLVLFWPIFTVGAIIYGLIWIVIAGLVLFGIFIKWLAGVN